MPTLPDLFDTLAEHGECAGADAVVARAIAGAHTDTNVVALDAGERASRRRRPFTLLVAAAVTIALVTVPIALLGTDHTPRPSREPSGPAYPAPTPATAAQLATLHWSHIANPPIPLDGSNEVVAWAGDEVIVYGADGLHADPKGRGAAYSPATGRWRVLPKGPLKGDWFFAPSWTWTGRELIVFPTTTPDTRAAVGEAYSPSTDSWRVLAPAPLCTVPVAGIAWTGTAVVVAGGYDLSGSQCADARVARSAFYDPRTDLWTLGPRLPVRAGDRFVETRMAWVDGRVIAVVGSQRSGEQQATPNTTPGSTTTFATAGASNAGSSVTSGKDAIVRVYALRPGARAWAPLGDLTRGTAGETAQDRWQPSVAGSRLVLPPSLRFCGEGNVSACSIAGVQAGSVFDVESGERIPLAVPTLPYSNDVDTTAFTGGALFGSLYAGSGARTYAWDVATGRRLTLPNAPERVMAAVWTGHELIALAFPETNGPLIGLRFG